MSAERKAFLRNHAAILFAPVGIAGTCRQLARFAREFPKTLFGFFKGALRFLDLFVQNPKYIRIHDATIVGLLTVHCNGGYIDGAIRRQAWTRGTRRRRHSFAAGSFGAGLIRAARRLKLIQDAEAAKRRFVGPA